jgi:hypothetical protein
MHAMWACLVAVRMRRRWQRWPLALAVLLCVLMASNPATAGDPDRIWNTLETDHFVIHYYQPMLAVAQRVAVVAERSHELLSVFLDHVPKEKCQVVLVDDVDGANGFAGVLPRNSITLFATAPAGPSVLNDHDDWLFGLVVHEYSHILHLDTMRGLPVWYNAIFGKTWAPNQVMPRWVIEGIATYIESKFSSSGRTRSTTFDMYLRAPVLAGDPLGIDGISGSPRALPRGNAAYLYGSHFLRYIFDRFGSDTLRKMSHTSGAYPIPFAINRQINQVVGQPFTQLYQDWMGHLRDRYSLQSQAVARAGLISGRAMTTTGESNVSPVFSADGKEVIWFASDGVTPARIRAMPLQSDASVARDVFQDDALGAFSVLPDGGLLFEQTQNFRRDYSYQELMWWDKKTGRTTQLTTGQRARDPAMSPDGRTIAFSKNGESSSAIAVMDFAPNAAVKDLWRGQRFDQAYAPSWSPDGKRLAFSVWQKGGYRDIVLLDVTTKQVTSVTRDRALDNAPFFSSDGKTVFFDSDRTGISNIFAYDINTAQTWQVTNVVGGAFAPAVSPDGKTLVFHAFDHLGNNVFSLPVNRSTWRLAQAYIDDRPNATNIKDAPIGLQPRPYRAMETLAPQTFTLQTQFATQAMTATLQTQGTDSAGLHNYNLALGLGLDSGDLNVGGAYGYDGARQFVRLAASRNISDRTGFRIDGVSKPYREEQWSATVAIGIPNESRSRASWAMSVDYDIDWSRLVSSPAPPQQDPNMRVPKPPQTDFIQSGLGLRGSFGSVRGQTFSLGPQRGWDVSFGLRVDHPALGATNKNLSLNYSARWFNPLPWSDTATLAARLGGGFRTGDLVRGGGFGIGGVADQDVPKSIVDSTRFGSTGYLRGYPARTVFGNQFHLANLELRQEVLQLEKGAATLPVYLRRIHIAGLVDAVAAWDGEPTRNSTRLSFGAAMRLDTLLGYFVPGTFEVGYARGLIHGGINETWLLLTGSL